MAEDILSKKAPFKDVALLIIYALPSIIATSAPFAALVGTLMGVGRLVSDREILAMNALGVSLRFIFLPILAVGILVSMVSFMTNDILLPLGTIKFNSLYRKILTSTPALELESNSIKRSQNAIVISGTIKNETMDSILLIDSDNMGNKRVVAAPDAKILKSNDYAILMTLEMQNALVASFDKRDRKKFDIIEAQTISYNMLAKNLLSNYSSSVTPREMTSRDLYREIQRQEIQENPRVLNMWKMEFHKKFTIPFGAFFFVILSFPLGLTAKTNGQSVGFIFGLIIAVLYWAMLIGGQTLSVRLDFNGTLAMWLPNLVVLLVGLIALGRRFFK
ncbi:LptF/LptG family permease [Brucepastera parasyntrophica]|uniref:LptF/LptG family permease n=1 Tax=Brucepastera parasyntrophica TaxID=2880008 RepID=UPI00210ED1C5|nr:LptF/LptG family permease [Brucepastera parasyntrophica]